MDDIYRHYISPGFYNNSETMANGRKNGANRKQDINISEDYEEGDVTGYAMQQPQSGLVILKFI